MQCLDSINNTYTYDIFQSSWFHVNTASCCDVKFICKKKKSKNLSKESEKLKISVVRFNLLEMPGLVKNNRHDGDDLINIKQNRKTDPITS